jgi:hypothetical protein
VTADPDVVSDARLPDACPYPRPFGDDFSDCPAYVPRRWPTYTSTGQPLRTVWTCWHLGPRGEAGQAGHFYESCELGDRQDRIEWAERAGPEQLAAYRRFRQALGAIEDELIAAAIPGQVALGYPQSADTEAARLRLGLDELALRMQAAAEPHAHLLGRSGIRVEDWVLVTRSVIEHMVARRSGPWTPSAALLETLSPTARQMVGALARPADSPTARPAPGSAHG